MRKYDVSEYDTACIPSILIPSLDLGVSEFEFTSEFHAIVWSDVPTALEVVLQRSDLDVREDRSRQSRLLLATAWFSDVLHLCRTRLWSGFVAVDRIERGVVWKWKTYKICKESIGTNERMNKGTNEWKILFKRMRLYRLFIDIYIHKLQPSLECFRLNFNQGLPFPVISFKIQDQEIRFM